ncbi:MAG: alpha/beta hydrolase [Myxococcaceae bacterium]
MSELFKSDEARERVRRWHHVFRESLGVTATAREVETSFGTTHLLVAGPPDGPPLITLHGAMASSSHLLRELEGLTTTFRVYALDVIGQSAMSADVRLDVGTDAYERWLGEVMDRLDLPAARVLGVSWGGFVAQRFAAFAPQRVTHLALLVPAGMVTGSWWDGVTRMGVPMSLYLLSPTEKRLHAFVRNLLTTMDPQWVGSLADSFTAYAMGRMKVPKLSRDGEFAALKAPVLVIGAEHDVSFPGEKVVARAKALFPTLAGTEVIADAQHSPPTTPEFRAWLAERLSRFFG